MFENSLKMLEYVGICWNMLEYVGMCWKMSEYVGKCLFLTEKIRKNSDKFRHSDNPIFFGRI